MKVALGSDLHLESYANVRDFGLSLDFINNTAKADALVLAGDIMDSSVFFDDQIRGLFTDLSANYPLIIYVMGNHEHYCGDFAKTHGQLTWMFSSNNLKNIHILEKSGIDVGDVRIFGGTMWTNFDNGNPVVQYRIERGMNDYRYINNSKTMVTYRANDEDGNVVFKQRPAVLTATDTLNDHKLFIEALNDDIANNTGKQYFIVTHHAPSYTSCDRRYIGDGLNPGYMSNLNELMMHNPQIKNWAHGHLHRRARVNVGDCKIWIHARGYRGEFGDGTFTPHIFEI